jgi:hypothetical protein
MLRRPVAPVAVAVFLGLAFAGATSTQAAPKTDVVVLRNGDHLTVEVVRLTRGRLQVKTDDAGTIDIEWDKVKSLTAVRVFEVITSDGSRYLGGLGHQADWQLTVLTSDGDVTLQTGEVTDLFPLGASFWRRIDGSFDAGFTYTRSSGVATTTVNSTTAYRRPSSLVQLTFSATLTQGGDSEDNSDDRAATEMSYRRYRGRRQYFSGAIRLENNESLGIALRSQVAGQLGLRLVNTNRAQFAVGAGMVVNDEIPVDAPERQNVEGLVATGASFYTYDRPKTNLDVTFQYYPSFSSWGRQRLQFDSSVKRELWRDFFCALDVFDTFDSRPPEPGAARNDVGVVVSIGWSY